MDSGGTVLIVDDDPAMRDARDAGSPMIARQADRG